jgi:2,4-dichlorophenol 6-monooxygenase
MHIQRIGPQAHDMEIGYSYAVGALVSDGTLPPPRDPMAGVYHPSTRPGSRLPHAWLEGPAGRVGTHDLVRAARLSLLSDDENWSLAASRVTETCGVPIDLVLIGHGTGYRDVDGSWARRREVEPGGAVLVRPDGHVAWRSVTRPADPAASLGKAVRAALNLGTAGLF